MSFINTSDVIGSLLFYLTENVTGHIFLTLLFIVIMLVAVAMIFRIPLEMTVIIIFPLLLVSTAYTASFYPVLAVAILYLAFMFALKNPLGR